MSKLVIFGITNAKGGIESLIHNLVLQVLISKSFESITLVVPPNPIAFESEYLQMGIHIQRIPPRKDKNYYFELKKILNELDSEDVAYANVSSYCNWKLFKALQSAKSRVVIHGHQANITPFYKKPLHAIGKSKYIKLGTKIAVSEICNDFMFNNHADCVIYNGIDSNKFKFNRFDRNEIRSLLGIKEDEVIIGYVGRFYKEKNTKAVITFAKKYPNIKFVLVGYNKDKYGQEVIRGGTPNCIFTGEVDCVEKYMSSFDALIVPSPYEAFPFVMAEAITNGLPVFCYQKLKNNLSMIFDDNGKVLTIRGEELDTDIVKYYHDSRNNNKVAFTNAFDQSLYLTKLINVLSGENNE